MPGFLGSKGQKAHFGIVEGGLCGKRARKGQHARYAACVVARAGYIVQNAVHLRGPGAVVVRADNENRGFLAPAGRQNGLQIALRADEHLVVIQRIILLAEAQSRKLASQIRHRLHFAIRSNRAAADFFREYAQLPIPVIHVHTIGRLRMGGRPQA